MRAGRRAGYSGDEAVMSRLVVLGLITAVLVTAGSACSGSSPPSGALVGYREPSQGWSTKVPAGWAAVASGPTFVRGDPLSDPTRLLIRAYPGMTTAAAAHALMRSAGIVARPARVAVADRTPTWRRYRGHVAGDRSLGAELAVARERTTAYAALLVARRAELPRLVDGVLAPALTNLAPAPVERSRSVLARTPAAPAYWPTSGWRTATPGSQGMDGDRLDAMVAEIRAARLPIDSVTVVRHGYVVLDRRFGAFASASLGAPYAHGRLHELQSATKSVTSMLVGIALRQRGATLETRLVDLAAAVDYVPAHDDARKQRITLRDLLTMQSGLAWHESGYAYEPGSGNDVVKMLARRDWMRYAIDRPMAAEPGTTFAYDTGATHLLSGAITVLTKQTEGAYAAKRLFAPLGIRDVEWLLSPEGVNAGGFGLRLSPPDLAKLGFLYLHHGRWAGRQIVPPAWVRQSTTDQVADPLEEYGYLWWLDRADGYAFMAGLYGQLAAVVPDRDLVAVVTAHVPASRDGVELGRWLLERYVLPAAG
jgi:CubicO group peptidase (beta-lactamase class C family)